MDNKVNRNAALAKSEIRTGIGPETAIPFSGNSKFQTILNQLFDYQYIKKKIAWPIFANFCGYYGE